MSDNPYQNRYASLTSKEQEFADRYSETLDPLNSAIDAGYSLKVARQVSYSWLKKPHLKPDLYQTCMYLRHERIAKFHVESSELIRRQWLIATADPAELIDLVRVNCRHCWGENFGYQWKEHEFEAAVAASERPGKDAPSFPDYGGGFGFSSIEDPNPECPYCHGQGHEEVRAKDQRDLSEAGRALLKGVKVAKNGLEVMMHDQQAAARLFAELAGYKIDRKELTGANGGPLLPPVTTITTSDPNEAARIYADMMKGGKV